MDEKNRKFNIIDLIIVLLILAVVGSIVGKFMYPDFFKTQPDVLTVSCTLKSDSEKSPYISTELKSGDKLYMGSNAFFGTVTEISFEKEQVFDEEGNPQEKEVYTVIAVCEFKEIGGAYVLSDGTAVISGSNIKLNTKDTLFNFTLEKTIVTKVQ